MAPPRPSQVGKSATALALLLCALISHAGDNKQEFDEYQVKAAFLCKLAGYITWPAKQLTDNDKEFRIAIVGKDPFGEQLDKATKNLKDQKLHGRPVVIKRYKSISEYQPSHLTFISSQSAEGDDDKPDERLAKFLKNHSGALVVADSKGLAEKGAMINFQLRDQRVAFEINAAALKRAGFQLTPSVIKMGTIVNDE